MKKFLTFIMMLVVSTSLALAKDIETDLYSHNIQTFSSLYCNKGKDNLALQLLVLAYST